VPIPRHGFSWFGYDHKFNKSFGFLHRPDKIVEKFKLLILTIIFSAPKSDENKKGKGNLFGWTALRFSGFSSFWWGDKKCRGARHF